MNAAVAGSAVAQTPPSFASRIVNTNVELLGVALTPDPGTEGLGFNIVTHLVGPDPVGVSHRQHFEFGHSVKTNNLDLLFARSLTLGFSLNRLSRTLFAQEMAASGPYLYLCLRGLGYLAWNGGLDMRDIQPLPL